MRNINTILFDGTLLDTLEDLADSVNFVLKEFGYPSVSLENVRNYVGNGVARLMELSLLDGKGNPQFEECLAKFKERYAGHMQDKTKPYQGIPELLQQLWRK